MLILCGSMSCRSMDRGYHTVTVGYAPSMNIGCVIGQNGQELCKNILTDRFYKSNTEYSVATDYTATVKQEIDGLILGNRVKYIIDTETGELFCLEYYSSPPMSGTTAHELDEVKTKRINDAISIVHSRVWLIKNWKKVKDNE